MAGWLTAWLLCSYNKEKLENGSKQMPFFARCNGFLWLLDLRLYSARFFFVPAVLLSHKSLHTHTLTQRTINPSPYYLAPVVFGIHNRFNLSQTGWMVKWSKTTSVPSSSTRYTLWVFCTVPLSCQVWTKQSLFSQFGGWKNIWDEWKPVMSRTKV